MKDTVEPFTLGEVLLGMLRAVPWAPIFWLLLVLTLAL
jgi:hypothetical protein